MELHPFKARQEELSRHIQEVSTSAVIQALDKRNLGEASPYHTEIQPQPSGISRDEYLGKVQLGVHKLLDELGCSDKLSFTVTVPAETGDLAERKKKSLFTRHYHQGPGLVFHELHA